MTELVVKELTKKFGDNLVVDNISFTVPSEKFVTILGPSGCGKTTVLRCIVGVEKPDEGRMNLGDNVLFSKDDNLLVPTEKRGMGMVYQSYALWPHMTVFDNVAYPLEIRKMEVEGGVGNLAEFGSDFRGSPGGSLPEMSPGGPQ